jgi:hypothetical protein
MVVLLSALNQGTNRERTPCGPLCGWESEDVCPIRVLACYWRLYMMCVGPLPFSVSGF